GRGERPGGGDPARARAGTRTADADPRAGAAGRRRGHLRTSGQGSRAGAGHRRGRAAEQDRAGPAGGAAGRAVRRERPPPGRAQRGGAAGRGDRSGRAVHRRRRGGRRGGAAARRRPGRGCPGTAPGRGRGRGGPTGGLPGHAGRGAAGVGAQGVRRPTARDRPAHGHPGRGDRADRQADGLVVVSTLAPRVVVVSRRSELDELLIRHGTIAAAAYFLRQRGRDLDEVMARHEALQAALTTVGAAVPPAWRRGLVTRDDLPRFLFAPEDVVVAVGQDGLVANVAKYLDGQPVIGVDPEPGRNPGVLVRHTADTVGSLLKAGEYTTRDLTMVGATLDDGQELLGLNEVYIGHPTHQSSRYLLSTSDGQAERQSSSGVVVGTGTGATGWCA